MTKGERWANNGCEDLAWILDKCSDRSKLIAALDSDPDALKEWRSLIGDLFSLIEVIYAD